MNSLFFFAVIFGAGFVSTFFAVFSGGGAIIALPALLVAGLGPAQAVATTRLGVTAASFAGFPLLKGKLGMGKKIPLLIIFFHTIGAIIGALVLIQLPESLFFGVVGIILFFGGVITFFSRKGKVAAKKHQIGKKTLGLGIILLFLIGIYRGFFGPASGTLNRLVFVNVLSFSQIQSLAIENFSAVVASFFSTIIFLFFGLVNFRFGLILAVSMIAGSVFGIKTALYKGNYFLAKAFGAITMALGVYLFFFQ